MMLKKIYILVFSLLCGTTLLGQNYRIGDLYTAPDGSQGIVFYLFPDGSGGWVVALNDASSGCAWGNGTDVPNIPNYLYNYSQMTRDTAGYTRTVTLRSYQNNNSNYAAGVVDIDNGWYLPSTGQLCMLFGELPRISSELINAGGTDLSEAYYWCAAEYNEGVSWAVDFRGPQSSGSMGGFCSLGQSTFCHVRAVRTFKSIDNPDISYSWSTGETTSGITVTPMETTTYTVTASMTDGKSDTVQHTIVVNATSSEEIDVVSLTPYVWNGVTYSQSGDYTVTFTNAVGCDSVVTLHLTMAFEVSIVASDDTICEGESVTLEVQVDNNQVVYVGDILCSDNSIVSPLAWPVTGKTAMGIVFHVDSTGMHGWAVHLHDQNTSIKWGGYGTNIPTMTNYSSAVEAIMDLDGYTNTQNIRNAGGASTFPAAYAVDFDNGWYIPAAGQLRLLYAEIVAINASLQVVNGTKFPMNSGWYYWSSTEYGDNYAAWCVYIYGHVYRYYRNENGVVRSVRTF